MSDNIKYLQTINLTPDVEMVFSKNFEREVFQDKKFFTIHPHEEIVAEKNVIDDGSITYILNDDFFRCDNFKKEHDGKHVLFAGCSETEGVGGNLEETWAYDLYKNLSIKNKLSGYFNVGRSGYGFQKIILTCMSYIKKYGNPDYLIILLPNIGRGFFYNSDNNTWRHESKFTCRMTYKYHESTIEEEKSFFINFVIIWQVFEEFCKTNNIKLIWSTWDHSFMTNIENLDIFKTFNNFFPIKTRSATFYKNHDILDDFVNEKTIEDDKFLKQSNDAFEKRDGHQGRIMHSFWSYCFLNKITKDGILI